MDADGATRPTAMTEAERADYLIRHCAGGNARAFGAAIGVSAPRVSRIVHGTLRLNRLYGAILERWPEVEEGWLRTGEGYPGDLDVQTAARHYRAALAERDATIASLARSLDAQRMLADALRERLDAYDNAEGDKI